MAFYDLTKDERIDLVSKIHDEILSAFRHKYIEIILSYFDDEDTYIRKTSYLSIGKIFNQNIDLQYNLISLLKVILENKSFRVRQTAINAAGEIGKKDFQIVRTFFDIGLFDVHHSPRNAVIGSIKKMAEVNPKPVLEWAKKYLHHPDKEIRREICHGIELRGRKHPADILPLLKELEQDKTARVRNTLVHVLGQIAYKKGCLETVVEHLKGWKNSSLVSDALEEIIDVHHRYRDFAFMSQEEAKNYIELHT